MARGTLSHARVACEGPRPTMKGGTFCRRDPGRRAVLLHRDQEVSPTGIYETSQIIFANIFRLTFHCKPDNMEKISSSFAVGATQQNHDELR